MRNEFDGRRHPGNRVIAVLDSLEPRCFLTVVRPTSGGAPPIPESVPHSAPVLRVAGLPSRFTIASQPTTGAPGVILSPLVVNIVDSQGNTVATDASTVTISLVGTGATLGGTLAVTAINGVATFSDLTLSAGGTYRINVTDSDFFGQTGTTAAITVSTPTPTPTPSPTPIPTPTPTLTLATTLQFGATAFAEDPTGTTVYATVPALGEVVAITEATQSVSKVYTVGGTPTGLAVSNDGLTVYVADNSTNKIDVISTAAGTVGTPLMLAGGVFPTDVQIGTNNRLWVLAGSQLLQIDATSGASSGAATATQSGDIRISPDGTKLFAANYGLSPSNLDAFDVSGATAAKIFSVAPGSKGMDLELSRDGSTFVLVSGGGNGVGRVGTNLDLYSAADGTSHSTTPLAASSFAFSHDNLLAFAGQARSNSVRVFTLTKDASGVLNFGTGTGMITTANPAQKIFSSSNGDLFVDEGSTTEIFASPSPTPAPTPGPTPNPTPFPVPTPNPTPAPTPVPTPILAPPTPTHVVFGQPPSSTVRNAPFGTAVVYIEDQYDQLMRGATNSVSLVIAKGPAGASLEGITTVNAVDGTATFTGAIPNEAGSYVLEATSGKLITADTAKPIKVLRPEGSPTPTAAKLVFAQTPATSKVGQPITPAVRVYVESDGGDIITSDNSRISLAIGSGPTGAKLMGTISVRVKHGFAKFSNILLSAVGKYRLVARDGSLTRGLTLPFRVKK